MRQTTRLVGLTLVVMLSVIAFRAAHVKGQSANPNGLTLNNWAGIGGASRHAYSLAISKGGQSVGSLTIPAGSSIVVAFNNSQPHPIDPAGGRFEFHGDFAIYPEPPSYMSQSRFHPDKTDFQWASEGPFAITGHDMDLVITKVQ